MKKCLQSFILFLALLISSTYTHAQTEKGKSVMGFNTGIYAYKLKYNLGNDNYLRKVSSQTIEVNYGKFIRKDLLLGLGLGLSHNKSTDGNINGELFVKNKGISLSPFVRQYFLAKENFSFFAGAGYTADFIRNETNNSDNVPKTRYLNSSLKAELGMNYFVSKNFALEAKLNTTSDLTDLAGSNDNGLTIGVKYWPGNTDFTPTEEINTDFKNWVVGLDINTATTATTSAANNEVTQTEFDGQLYAGKFFGSKRNHLAGIGVGRGSTRYTTNTGSSVSSNMVFTPFYEYYCKTNRLTPVAGLSSSFFFFGNNSNNSVFYNETNLNFGLAYFLKDHFIVKANFITLGLTLQHIENNTPSVVNAHQFDFSIFNNSTVGLAYRW